MKKIYTSPELEQYFVSKNDVLTESPGSFIKDDGENWGETPLL